MKSYGLPLIKTKGDVILFVVNKTPKCEKEPGGTYITISEMYITAGLIFIFWREVEGCEFHNSLHLCIRKQ